MIDTNAFWVVIALAVIALAISVSIALLQRSRQRSASLRERFGPEYNRAVQQFGGKAGERVLAERARRVDQIDFRELSDSDRGRFTLAWTTIQAQFVDDPGGAVSRANELIKDVMRARGYSSEGGFDQRAADLSVDHPDVVEHYRAARALSQGGPAGQGLNTEQLRQAVVHYRVLFADLLQPARPTPPSPGTLSPAHA